jgi:RNA polymerase sigma-70 factor, ECF subfamily
VEKEKFDGLIKRIRQGDNEAFEQIVRAYIERIIRFIFNIGVKENYEDVAQITWLKFYRAIWRCIEIFPGLLFWQYNEISPELIFIIAKNEAFRYLKQQSRNPAKPLETEISEFESLEKDENIPKSLEEQQRKQQLVEYIRKLPPEFREVIILRDIHEYEYKAIAETLNISLGLVKTRIRRGRNMLRELLFGKEL